MMKLKLITGLTALSFAATAQTVLVDYDDGVANGVHESSIANGGFEESAEADGVSLLYRSAAPGTSSIPGYWYSYFEDTSSGGNSVAGPYLTDTGGLSKPHRTTVVGWGSANNLPRRQLTLMPPTNAWTIADGDQFHLELSAKEGSAMDDEDWLKIFVYAVDYTDGNSLTQIGDNLRLDTPNDGSWNTGVFDVNIDFNETGDLSGQGIAFRFFVDRDSGSALRNEFCLLDDFYLVADNGSPLVLPEIEAFTATDYYVAPSTSVDLSWGVTNADTVTIVPDIGTVPNTGSQSVSPTNTQEYTLTATSAYGQTTETIRIGVGPPRPNIVFFLVDDMGTQDTSEPFHWDSEGDPVQWDIFRTPNMENLAHHGMKFVNAYAMPVCTPSRVCWATGKNAVRHRVTNWTDPTGAKETGQNSTSSHNSPTDWLRGGIAEAEIPFTLPSLLQDAGYRTIHCGKGHFGNQGYNSNPLDVGFDVNIGGSQIGRPGEYTGDYGAGGSRSVPGLDEYHNTGTFLTEALTLEINDAIGQAVSNDTPFFAYMSHYAVHSPFNKDPRFEANYSGLGLTSGQIGFATLVEGMDKSLGDIVTNLINLGVAEDTLIVFMGDNGSDSPYNSPNSSVPLRGRKGYSYEGGVRVPFIVSWAEPDTDSSSAFQTAMDIPTNTVEESIIAIFDLFPTFLSVAGVPHSHEVDGYDMTEYFRGTPGEHRPQELLIHFPHDHQPSLDYYTTLRQENWKLLYNYPNNSFELYDLTVDEGEVTDLAALNDDRVMTMARRMAQLLNDAGAQWPTFNSGGSDDPYTMPILAGVDIDGDGIEDNAEDPNTNGLVDAGETDPDSSDTDADTTPDGAELQLGLNPLDPEIAFTVEWFEDSLTWPSLSGTVFRAESSSNLIDWVVHMDNIPANTTGTFSEVTINTAEEAEFFRIQLK